MKKILLVLLQFILNTCAIAQTGGLGYVTDIESKAKSIVANRQLITVLDNEILAVGDTWAGKIKALKQEIADLGKERDNIISDMKVGAKCSKCNDWKTEIEKSGKETFQQHLGTVGGYAIPATTQEIETTRTGYKEQIAYKKVVLQNLEKQDPAAAKRKEIDNLKALNIKYCTDITDLSKAYGTVVLANAKSTHIEWFGDIMTTLAQQHIAEDKLTLAKVKKTIIQQKYTAEVAAVKAKKKEALLNKQNELTTNKLLYTTQITDATTAYNENLKAKEKEILALQQTINADTEKRKTETDANIKAGLEIALETNMDLLATLNREKANIGADNYKNIQQLNGKILQANDELKQITLGTSSIDKATTATLDILKTRYDAAIGAADFIIENSAAYITDYTKSVSKKKNSYKQKNIQLVNLVVAECNRMTLAGQTVNCFVHNDVQLKVAQNYNTQESCVITLTSSTLNRSYSSSGVACVAKFTAYTSTYKLFANALTADDKEAIKQTTFYSWYQKMLE